MREREGTTEPIIKIKKQKTVASGQLSTSKDSGQQEQVYREKYYEYRPVLVTSHYEFADKQLYKQTLQKIFQEKVLALREIISLQRFEDDIDISNKSKSYRLSLYKLLMVLATAKEKYSIEITEEQCWVLLDWLSENGIEQILNEFQGEKLLQFLLSTNDQMVVRWALKKYGDSQLLEAFTEFNESDQPTSMEIANIVMQKKREVFISLAEKRKSIEEEWEKWEIQTDQIRNRAALDTIDSF